MEHHHHNRPDPALRTRLLDALAALAELATVLIALLNAELERSSIVPDMDDATHTIRKDVPPPG